MATSDTNQFLECLRTADEALAKSKRLLESTAVHVNGESGWRQFLDEPPTSAGTFGSACGLIAYLSGPSPSRAIIDAVVDHIANRQLLDGSWDSRAILTGLGLTTATCYSCTALNKADPVRKRARIDLAVQWLTELISGGAPVGHCLRDRDDLTVCMALVIQTLDSLGHGHEGVQALSLRICRMQNDDGGWGMRARTPSTLAHTIQVLLALESAQFEDKDIIFKAGLNYVNTNWSVGRNDERDTSYVYAPDGSHAMMPHTFFSDGLLLQLQLASEGVAVSDRTLELIDRLCATQNVDGGWSHQTAPAKTATWALMEAMLPLAAFSSRGHAHQAYLELMTEVRGLRAATDKAIQLALDCSKSQVEIGTSLKRIQRQANWLLRFRFLWLGLAMFTLYMVLRPYLDIGTYGDIIAVAVAVIICVAQLIASVKGN
jgi:hypothetical protein